jgi:hypothetical protein
MNQQMQSDMNTSATDNVEAMKESKPGKEL